MPPDSIECPVGRQARPEPQNRALPRRRQHEAAVDDRRVRRRSRERLPKVDEAVLVAATAAFRVGGADHDELRRRAAVTPASSTCRCREASASARSLRCGGAADADSGRHCRTAVAPRSRGRVVVELGQGGLRVQNVTQALTDCDRTKGTPVVGCEGTLSHQRRCALDVVEGLEVERRKEVLPEVGPDDGCVSEVVIVARPFETSACGRNDQTQPDLTFGRTKRQVGFPLLPPTTVRACGNRPAGRRRDAPGARRRRRRRPCCRGRRRSP